MKKIFIGIVSLLLLVVGAFACSAPPNPIDPANWSGITAPTAYATPIVIRETAVPVVIRETAVPVPPTVAPTNAPPVPPATVAPQPTAEPTRPIEEPVIAQNNGSCDKTGTLAWHADNLPGSQVYGSSEIGGLPEGCGVVAQLWTSSGGTERWFVYVRPNSYVAIANHKGGSGWYFGGTDKEVMENLQKQQAEIEQRDGAMKQTILILPDQVGQFRLVTRWGQAGEDHVVSNVQPTLPVVAQPTTTTPVVETPLPAVGKTQVAGKCDGQNAVGPAILEFGDRSNGKATVLKLNAGSTSPKYNGGCYAFPSQQALDTRWPAHKAEFMTKNVGGQALEK